jgi:TonB family protein
MIDDIAQNRHIIQLDMHPNKYLLMILACLSLASTTWSSSSSDTDGPEALLSRARTQEAIWAEGTPPMMMRADIQISDAKGNPVHGGYTLEWVSPSRWREEIRFGDYDRLRVREATGYWQKSGLSYQPEIIFQLDTMLHLKDALRLRLKQSFGKAKTHEVAGVRQKCAEVKWAKGTDRIMCFDEASGTLVSIEYPQGANQNPPEITRIEYGAFNAVAGKLVPYEIRAFRERKVVASFKVLESSRITDENPPAFNVPQNAEFWGQCDDMQDAEFIDRVQPIYPANARANREQGRVIFYAVIEEDGSLSHLTLIHRATPALEASATEAVRRWRYRPPTCGQTPIRTEVSIETDFWLRY